MRSKKFYDYTVYENGVILGKNGNPIKPQKSHKGYAMARFDHGGKYKTKTLHRLIAELFIPNPENLSDVDHIDGDRFNYHVDNLRWVSHGENIKYSYESGRRSALGERNSRCKTSEEEVRKICSHLQSGMKVPDVRDLGYDYGLVRAIKSRKNWNHISCDYHW